MKSIENQSRWDRKSKSRIFVHSAQEKSVLVVDTTLMIIQMISYSFFVFIIYQRHTSSVCYLQRKFYRCAMYLHRLQKPEIRHRSFLNAFSNRLFSIAEGYDQ